MRAGSRSFFRLTKPPLFLLCLLPATHMTLGAFGVAGIDLGANPVEKIQDTFGLWGLRLLLVTLAVTPLQRWTRWLWLPGYRRMLGLFAFFYVVLHFMTYVVLDLGLDFAHLAEDIAERPFITIGVLALLGLVPMAVTSTRGWQRRLGRRWKQLHRLIYPVAILGVWHFYWQVKLDTLEPSVYALILAGLLGARLLVRRGKRRRQRLVSAGEMATAAINRGTDHS